ncbi:bifunctional Aspartyl-Glutamyl-tRNA(Gln) amidotransferase [Babesia duncani]|uniref:Bifunctional Aspartyl-Glutamyl-tRNA(Gln) amidotransferase n=1 Tax=Babesia duncani TaxID=323732 RepID=A0AAD9PLI5_9APIC|nr:bifunctional Aspartyl-Glutamyl-tRNA(Gln) amidotransferase [Babesia duncani]
MLVNLITLYVYYICIWSLQCDALINTLSSHKCKHIFSGFISYPEISGDGRKLLRDGTCNRFQRVNSHDRYVLKNDFRNIHKHALHCIYEPAVTHDSTNNQIVYKAGIEAHVQLGCPSKVFCPCRSTATATTSSETESECGDVGRIECEKKRLELFLHLSNILDEIKSSPGPQCTDEIFNKATKDPIGFFEYVHYYCNNIEKQPFSLLDEESSDLIYRQENTNTCPVCLGQDGATPYLSPLALLYGIAASKAFDCQVTNEIKFDRKVYQYVDLPKGYQISQTLSPLGVNGHVELKGGRRINIQQIQLEEDTAKRSSNATDDNETFDYNRCGIALVEIITSAAEMTQSEILETCTLITKRVVDYGICNGLMHRGNLRFDINLSLPGSSVEKVEIKNLISFRRIKKVINQFTEAVNSVYNNGDFTLNSTDSDKWQDIIRNLMATSDALDQNQKSTTSVTLGWKYREKRAQFMRAKHTCNVEEESNIPTIIVPMDILDRIGKFINTNSNNQQVDILDKYKQIHPGLLKVITKHSYWMEYFTELSKKVPDINTAAAWFVNIIIPYSKSQIPFPISPERLATLINCVLEKYVALNVAKRILPDFIENWEGNAKDYIKKHNLELMSDHDAIEFINRYIKSISHPLESIRFVVV